VLVVLLPSQEKSRKNGLTFVGEKLKTVIDVDVRYVTASVLTAGEGLLTRYTFLC
jgi:hypothetical protein